jgi:mRNA-degrading endonuclease YafQ of YafQ-DinJ toxin-antitoxin module
MNEKIEIAFENSFVRALKKILRHNNSFESILKEKLLIFQNNPFDPILKTHKLSGQLNDLFSFSVDYGIRIIFYFFQKKAVFIDIGKHNDVY